jgi:HD superfamily phosphohydrolase
MSQRTYHDPLHRGIQLDSSQPAEAMVMALVDTAPFQRLRRVRQLGPAFLTFHGAESSRFTHSLGVFHLARRAFNRLLVINPQLETHRALVYAAALLHDIGHGPLSHTGEEMFGLHHESWSSRVIREHPTIHGCLEQQGEGTATAVADLLEHGRTPHPVVKRLVSSQLDCDRLDYLLRDSYSTGTRYGQLDLDRILAGLTLAPDGDLALHPKGLMAVEHYLVVRNLMYRSVYNHRLNVVCNWLLNRTIALARELGPDQVWADAVMQRWLWEPKSLDLEAFLGNDDVRTGYHLQRWLEEGPAPLQQLCGRVLNRELLRASDLSQLPQERRLALLARAQTLSESAGLRPDLCCGLHQQSNHGYHPYKGGLRLWDGHQLGAIEQRSPLIRSLIQPTQTAWLIHPPEITPAIREALALEVAAGDP